MKRFLIVVAVAFSALANAQELNYGVKATYNLSNISVSSPAISTQVLLGNKSGVGIGGFVEYTFQNNLSVQADVAYNLLGAKTIFDINEVPKQIMGQQIDFLDIPFRKASANISLHQISIPVSLKYNIDSFSVLAGVYANIVASVSQELTFDGQKQKNDEIDIDALVKEQINSTNFGAHIGGEYRFSNGIFIDARYNFGFSSLNKNFTDFINVRQRYMQLGVGYRF